MENKFTFEYTTENLGTLTITHVERDEKKEIDSLCVTGEDENELITIFIPFSTKPANAMKIIFDAIESLDYNG